MSTDSKPLLLGALAIGIGGLTAASLLSLKNRENYASVKSDAGAGSGYPTPPQFYKGDRSKNGLAAFKVNQSQSGGSIGLDKSGSQMLSYQLYQQGVNAATPTLQQLQSISGQSQQQTGRTPLDGGLSDSTAPYAILNSGGGSDGSAHEFQAVNLGSERAQTISACAQNAPTFVATSLLPKPAIPGQQAWDIGSPNNILANQNFLSATQQIGVDTVLSSTRNQSYDIRNNIPNPINVVSPFNNPTIIPDLEKRPLDCFQPTGSGLYGCGAPQVGSNVNGTFVGM